MIKLTLNLRDMARFFGATKTISAAARSGLHGLMPAVGQMITTQTQRRIASEKTAPDGPAWPRNLRGNGTLMLSGALWGSIHHRSGVFRTVVQPGNLPYAAIQNSGGVMRGNMFFELNGEFIHAKQVTLPSRQYMGLSAQNLAELKVLVDQYANRSLGWLS